MSSQVAVLETLLTANSSSLRSEVAAAETVLQQFASQKYAGARIGIQIDVNGANGKTSLPALTKALENLKSQKVNISIHVEATGAIQEVTKLGRALAQIKDKTVTVNVNQNNVGPNGQPLPPGSPPIPPANPNPRPQNNLGDDMMRRGYYNTAAGGMLSSSFTAPLVAGGTAALKFAGDFDEAMHLVGALTEVGKENVKGLAQQVLDLAKDPAIRAAPVELAQGLYYVASTGLKGADAMEALKASAIGAAAGLGSTQSIANTLTSVLKAYNLEASESSKVIDTITEGVRYGKGEATQYAGAVAKVIPLAAQAGVSFQEVMAQMASATRIGLTPAESATALRQIFANLIDPSEKAKQAMKSLGTSVEEVRSKLKTEGLFSTLQDLMKRSGGEAGPIFELFGNIRALTGFLATTGNGTLQEYQKTLKAIMEADGSTMTAASFMAESFNFQLDKLKSTAQAAAIEVGSRLIPTVLTFVKTVQEGIPSALRAWDTLPDGLKKVTIALGGLLALAGPLFSFVGLMQIMGGMGVKLATFAGLGNLFGSGGAIAGLAGGPVAWALIAAAILAAAGSALLLKKHFEDAAETERLLSENTKNLGRDFEKAFAWASGSNKASSVLKDLQNEVGKAGEDTKKLDTALKAAFDAKREIKELGLAPGAERGLMNAVEKVIADIENRKVHIDVSTSGAIPVNPGDPLGFIDAADRELYQKGKAMGITLPATPLDPSKQAEGARLQAGLPSKATKQEMEAYKKELEAYNQTKSEIRALVAEDNKLDENSRAAAREAFSKTIGGRMEKLLQDSPNNQKKLLAIMAEYNKKVKEGWAPDARTEGIGGDVQTRIAENAGTIQSNRDKAKQKSDDAEKIRSERLRAVEELNAQRSLEAYGRTLSERLQMWNKFASQVEGSMGRVRQLEEQGSVFGEKTAKARVEAELMKRAYDGIPKPLKDSLVAMAGIEYKMQRMLGMRDGLRELFNGIYGQLSQKGRAEFTKFAEQFEKQLGQGKQWAALQSQSRAMGGNLVGKSANEVAYITAQQDAIKESQRKRSEVYADAQSGGTGAIMSGNGKSLFEKFNLASKVDMTCADVASKTVEALGFHIKKSVNARQLERNAKAAGWESVDPRNAPEGSLVFKPSSSARSGVHAMMALGGGRLASSSNHKTDYFNASGRERAYAPPSANPSFPSDVSAPPTGNVKLDTRVASVPRRAVAAKALGQLDSPAYDSSLLTMRDLPKGWGGMMNDYRARPGENTGNREAFESFIQGQISKGAKFKDEDLWSARKGLTAADLDATTRSITDKSRDSIREMGRSIRLAGKEDNPYIALLDSFKYGENQFASSGTKKALEEMILGKMVSDTRQATRQMRRDTSNSVGNRNGTNGLLGDGFNQGAYDRAQFRDAKNREIWSSDDITKLYQAGKTIEANRQAVLRLTLAMQEYDSSKRTGALLGSSQEITAAKESNNLLSYQIFLLQDATKSQQELSDALEVERTRRAALKALNEGGVFGDEANRRADILAGQTSRGQRLNAFAGSINENRAYGNQYADSMAGAQARLGYTQAFRSGDPELDIRNQLAQKEIELKRQNRENPSQNIDVVGRLQDYEAQLRLGQESARTAKTKSEVLNYQNSTLDQQMQREMMLARTSKERLKIELEYEARKRELSAERETFEETTARIQLEKQREITAAYEDRMKAVGIQADSMKESIKGILNGEGGSLFSRLKDEAVDFLAARGTNMLYGKNTVDETKGGLLTGLLKGKLNAPSQNEGAGIASAVKSALGSAGVVQVSGTVTNVTGTTVNVAGGGTSSLPGLFGIGGGNKAGGSGTMPSPDQLLDGHVPFGQ